MRNVQERRRADVRRRRPEAMPMFKSDVAPMSVSAPRGAALASQGRTCCDRSHLKKTDVRFSPGGAAVVSQGRKPLV